MKIGLFNSTKSWGGGEKWYFEMAVYLANSGYEVHFYLTEGSALHQRLNVTDKINLHFVKVGSLSLLNPFTWRRLAATFRRHALDSLFVILSSDLKVAGRAATAAGIRKIIYTRAVPIPIKNTRLNRYIFNNWVTHVLVNSEATRRSVVKINPSLIADSKIRLIYNPVNVQEFDEREYQPLYQKRTNECVIGSVGRVEHEKNHSFLIDLSAALNESGIPHKILVAGTGSLVEDLKQRASKEGLEQTIAFVGFQPNVKNVLMSCELFILPSLFEGFGFAIAEASLCKLPVIAFDTTSIPELVANNETGFVVEVNDVEAVVSKIKFFRSHPEIATSMGEKGRLHVIENFDERKVMDELERLLAE